MEKMIGRILIISGIILQRYADTPFWLTICMLLGGFVWMDGQTFDEDSCEEE